MGEKVMVVSTLNLSIPLGEKTSFMTFNGTIEEILDLVNPFVANGFMTRRKRHHTPCVVVF